MSAVLTIKGLTVDSDIEQDETGARRRLVSSIDLDLQKGEVVGLIGKSGAGKTTIGLAALGYARPGTRISGGQILFDGIDLASAGTEQLRDIRGRRIAYIAQSAAAAFNPAFKLKRQVGETAVRHGSMSWKSAENRSVELFSELLLPAPGQFGERFPHQASGGQLQRAMAAMAVTCNPDLLVLDEPTTALDVTTQLEILATLRNLIRDYDTAALYISHDLAVVAQVADRIMVLRHGKMVELGKTDQILKRPHEAYTKQLLSARAAPNVLRAGSARSQETLLEVASLSIHYHGMAAVREASIELKRGETLAVVGESGSGKTTLARAICGLKEASAGSIKFKGKPLCPKLSGRSRDELRRIQLVYQMPDSALNPNLRVSTLVGRPLSFYHGMRGKKRDQRVKELLELVELSPDLVSRLPAELSGGQKQRVCIARALAAEPDLIVCDEVTSALDALVAEGILQLLDRLQKENGLAYLFITHDLGIVRRVADRIAVMLRGEIVAQGAVNKIFSPPYHPYTESLLSCVPELRSDWLDQHLARRAETSVQPPGVPLDDGNPVQRLGLA